MGKAGITLTGADQNTRKPANGGAFWTQGLFAMIHGAHAPS